MSKVEKDPVEKAKWKALSPKQRWDCLVALRGPDIKSSEAIKHFTTGVIRKEMGQFIRVGGQISDLGFVVIPQGAVFKQYGAGGLIPDLDHFVLHCYEAAEILGIKIVFVPPSVWEGLVLADRRSDSMIAFAKWASENKGAIDPCVYSEKIEKYVNYYVGEQSPITPQTVKVKLPKSSYVVKLSEPMSSPPLPVSSGEVSDAG